MKLWLDDLRFPGKDWFWLGSVNAAISVYRLNDNWDEVSLDHDLGDYSGDGGDGIKFVDFLCGWGIWPSTISIHSGNPVGRDNMMRTILRYGPYHFSNYNSAWVGQ